MHSLSSAWHRSHLAVARAVGSFFSAVSVLHAVEPSRGESARLADRLYAAEQSAAALRHRARELSDELERLRSENDSLRRRLQEAHERLTAVSRVAAAAEAERIELLRQAQDNAARIRALEAKFATNSGTEATAGMRELRKLLEERTRELADLRRRVRDLEAMARESEAPPIATHPAAPQPDEIRRMNEMFAAEKRTWQSLYQLAEEQRLEAETERNRIREELQQARARVAELEQRLSARATSGAAAPKDGERAVREALHHERTAREIAELRAEAFLRAWMNARSIRTNTAELLNTPAEPAR